MGKRWLSLALAAMMLVSCALAEGVEATEEPTYEFVCEYFLAKLPLGMQVLSGDAREGLTAAAMADTGLNQDVSLVTACDETGARGLNIAVITSEGDGNQTAQALADGWTQLSGTIVSSVRTIELAAGTAAAFDVSLEGNMYTQAVLQGGENCLVITCTGMDNEEVAAFLQDITLF